jgi:hypothetical protein
MKKICIFTQTYSDNRQELYYYHNNDKYDIIFRNNFENLYSFHNSSDEYVKHIMNNNYFAELKNLNMVRYNNISYTESFKITLNYLVKNEFDYLIFLQDDCFNLSNNMYITELVDFILKYDFDMLNLETTPIDLKLENTEIYYENNGFKVYNTSSEDFKNRGLYAFDDGAYVANINFLLNNLYDDNYFNKSDIWQSENYLNEKIKVNKIQRLTTNINFYNRINIVGPNNWDRINNLNILNDRLCNNIIG